MLEGLQILAAIKPVSGAGDVLQALLQTLLVMAATAAIAAGILSHMRYQALVRHAKKELESGGTRDAFALAIADRVGFRGRSSEPFGLLWMRLPGVSQGVGDPLPMADELFLAARARVHEQLRTQDKLILLKDRSIGLLLETGRANLETIARRVTEGFTRTRLAAPDGGSVKLDLDIAIASFPENGETADALLSAVEQAMAQGICIAPAAGPAAPSEPEEADEAQQQGHLVDELTGVLKPSRVGGAIQKYVARYRKEEEPVSIVVVDVDSLERYNGHYGREAGDAILRSAAKLLMDHCRESDLIGRLSGQEFVIVMPCPPADALSAAHRMTNEIRKFVLTFHGNRLRYTVSMGLAGFPDHGGSPVVLYDRAQLALRAAKLRGRGVAVAYEDALETRKAQPELVADSF